MNFDSSVADIEAAIAQAETDFNSFDLENRLSGVETSLTGYAFD